MAVTINPFTFGAMITDPQMFIGRAAEREQILARLNSSHPQGSAVVGPRRVGKSSLLYHLAHPTPNEALSPDVRLGVTYLSAASGGCSSPEEFRKTLIRALIDTHKVDRRSANGRWLYELRGHLANDTPCPWSTAREALGKLPFHPVVCLDEFEALLNDDRGMGDAFYDALRSWANEGLLTWVTASARSLAELSQQRNLTSPFFNLLATVGLGGLTDEEAEQLLARADATSHPFSPKDRQMLRKLGGRHPYHLQVVAWRLWEMKDAGQRRRTVRHQTRELRRYLCAQPSPPPSCSRWRIFRSFRLEWALIIILTALLCWLAVTGNRLRDVWQALRPVWEWLVGLGEWVGEVGEAGDRITGLVALIVILAVIVQGARRRRRLTDIVRSLWKRLS